MAGQWVTSERTDPYIGDRPSPLETAPEWLSPVERVYASDLAWVCSRCRGARPEPDRLRYQPLGLPTERGDDDDG